MLGVSIKNSSAQNTNQINDTIDKAQYILRTWGCRSLTLMGKIRVVNTLVMSLFVHTLMVLPLISERQMKNLESIIISFLWGTKRPKILIKILYRDPSEGGLRLTNLLARQKALQLRWFLKCNVSNELDYIYDWLDRDLKSKIWSCNIHKKDVKLMVVKDTYWRTVLET